MSQTHDDEIRKTAQEFAEAETLFQSAESKLVDATRELESAKSKRDRIKSVLAKCVGRNTPRRVVKLINGNIVLISHDGENNVCVEIHNVL